MERRAFLLQVAAGMGLLSGGTGAVRPSSRGWSSGAAGPPPELPVPGSDLEASTAKDAVPAIVEPAYDDDWSRIGYTRLTDRDEVLGVARGREARAYPLRLMNWHEVVNDTLGGPLLVTYCPLCGSGVTAVRTVAGQETTFGVSGMLWRSNLLLYDRLTDSLWSQIRAQAIQGPRTGDTLDLVPSTVTSWRLWRQDHPDTDVLLPPPMSGTIGDDSLGGVRNYARDPYAGYKLLTGVGNPRSGDAQAFADDRLHPKTTVIGVAAGGEARAYPLDAVREARVVNDAVGGLPVVVSVADPESTNPTLVAYRRTVDGTRLVFRPGDDLHMRAGGSTWSLLRGRAVDGPHDGTQLEPATRNTAMFWFAWLNFHPDTTVYRH